MPKPCIVRYLSETNLARMRTDFRDLMARARASHGDLEIMLRDGYFNLYYQGNSLIKVTFNDDGSYDVKTSSRFITTDELRALLPEKPWGSKLEPAKKQSRRYATFSAAGLAELLSKNNVKDLQAAVRSVNYQPETTFEQLLMAHNPPTEDFLIIDRQVQSRGDSARRKADLLALRRITGGRYRLVVLEVKLGGNDELAGEVAEQLADYMAHITANFDDFARCYEKVYQQRRDLPLWPGAKSLPETIQIEKPVEGKVVVFGRNRSVGPKIAQLLEKHPHVLVEPFDFRLKEWPAG